MKCRSQRLGILLEPAQHLTEDLFNIILRRISLTSGLPRAGNSVETLFTAPARADSDVNFKVWDCDIKVHFRNLCTFMPTSKVLVLGGLMVFNALKVPVGPSTSDL